VDVLSARPKTEDVMPTEPKQDASGAISEPRRVERIPANGALSERWKLTCVCGKRIYSPFHSSQPCGRCPVCGRRMRLPGYKASSRTVNATASQKRITKKLEKSYVSNLIKNENLGTQACYSNDNASISSSNKQLVASLGAALVVGHDAQSARAAEEVGTIIMEGPEVEELERQLSIQRAAVVKTADLLRAHRVSETMRSGIISAWPLAGKLPRALAGFIDLTFCTTAAGVLVALTAAGVLPGAGCHPAVLITAFLTSGLLNDILLQATCGGLGKRMVVLVLRRRNGQDLEPQRILARALLKWILLPGWLLAFVDPAERSLHDLACGTLVLKGRAR